MNSIVISPFWQSVDERWIGATLVVITLTCLVSTSLFVARYRSLLFFLIASGLFFLTAFLLAPVADAKSPKLFQLWLMSPETLAGLSMLQIFLASLSIFGSIRHESCTNGSNKISYNIRSWIVVATAVLPSPVLVSFIFWLEQNMMISTREQLPVVIGLKIAFVLMLAVAAFSLVFLRLNRYRLLTFHFFIGLFLLLSGALLPCLTTKLTVEANRSPAYLPSVSSIFIVMLAMAAFVMLGVWRQSRRRQIAAQSG